MKHNENCIILKKKDYEDLLSYKEKNEIKLEVNINNYFHSSSYVGRSVTLDHNIKFNSKLRDQILNISRLLADKTNSKIDELVRDRELAVQVDMALDSCNEISGCIKNLEGKTFLGKKRIINLLNKLHDYIYNLKNKKY